jgi:hypothetical protein
MSDRILVSSAYLPPVEYFSLLLEAGEIFVEKEENYLKQTYRNRCYILSAHGIQLLSVPVFEGSRRKKVIKDVRIDYSRRWQQVHLGAIKASYSASPYFEFYIEDIKRIIFNNYNFLLDLNMDLTYLMLTFMKITKILNLTSEFTPVETTGNDFRYSLSPKKYSTYRPKEYLRVFNTCPDDSPGISILDLIFNTGPEAPDYLHKLNL